jgi:hypothetical protein
MFQKFSALDVTVMDRHYARNFPTRKKGRQYASTTNIDPDPPQKIEEKREEK